MSPRTSAQRAELDAAVRDALAQQQHPSMTLAEGAARLGVSTRTLRRWVTTGRLPGYRTGPRLIRVASDDVDALQRKIPGASG